MILPVFSSRSFRRTYNQVNSGLKNLHWRSILPLGNSEKPGNTSKLEQKGSYALLPNNECAICAENSSFSLSNLTGTSDTHAFSHPIPSSTAQPFTVNLPLIHKRPGVVSFASCIIIIQIPNYIRTSNLPRRYTLTSTTLPQRQNGSH